MFLGQEMACGEYRVCKIKKFHSTYFEEKRLFAGATAMHDSKNSLWYMFENSQEQFLQKIKS